MKTPKQHAAHAVLIDGNALLHRAWHALPRLTSPEGRVVNAVYGFVMVLQKFLESTRPDYLIVCWDTPEPTYRHALAKEYKAQREEQPEEFYAQAPIVKEMIGAFGGKNVDLPGYEADDLLATLGTRLAKERVDVSILTSDRDLWQVIGPRVRMIAFKKGVTETVIYDETSLLKATGLTPAQIVDWKALVGDPSDNLKGVSGIGEKTATELITTYGSLENILKAAKDPTSDMTSGVRKKLVDGEASARLTRQLVELVRDAPIQIQLKELRSAPAEIEKLRELFLKLGFQRLLERMKLARLPQQQTVDSRQQETVSSAVISSTSVESVLTAAHHERYLVLQPVPAAQTSLFAGAVELAIGSRTQTALVTRSDCENTKIRSMLAAVLCDASVQKVGHNMKALWHWCRARNFILDGIMFDTEIAAYLLSAGERGYTLPTLAANRLKHIVSEGDTRPIEEIHAIRSLHTLFAKELEGAGLTTMNERFEVPLISILAEMEERGILIDRTYFKKLRNEFHKEKNRLEREMVKLAGEEFNPASPMQLARIFFDVLKLPIKGIKRGKTGISTAASELEKLEGAHPIVEKIREYREVAKLLSTYVEALPELADTESRVHTTFHQTIAATGRLSSTDPNLQNIPIRTELGRKIRKGFIAPQGHVLLSCDYSQFELRIVASLAKDDAMLDAFRRGIDVHTATAASIWKIPLNEVSREQRRAAKAINFGIIYGQGPLGLSKSAGVSFEEARQFIGEYFSVYAGIYEYLEQTKALAHAQGYVETLFGRRRPLPDINSPRPELRAASERMAVNMPVQGTQADLIKLAMIELARELPRLSRASRMLLQVHDELVFEIPDTEAVALAQKIVDIMQSVENIGCPVVVEAKAGKNWEEMKTLMPTYQSQSPQSVGESRA